MFTFDRSNAWLRLKYKGGKFPKSDREYPDLDEYRPLSLLDAPLSTLYQYTGQSDTLPPPERTRPRLETQAAILLQHISTDKPEEEEWINFWRDHFSIHGYDTTVGAFLPHWEQTVIRGHCSGNFREFLEAVATHPAMLYYLNNRSSRAGSPNENYARELFELHTLGQASYLNHLYADWKTVPGALQGAPEGFIDQDVYEAARAFTGWTVEDGSNLGGRQNLPATGKFTYIESRHDNYQKRVLATEFLPFAGAMVDGRKVLDLCAEHPGTARHLATKLVRRLISDNPPEALIQSTTDVWLKNTHHPEQLKRVFNHLNAEAHKIPAEQRLKALHPISLVARFVRATRLPFSLGDGGILSALEPAGPSLYGWPSPEGPPHDLARVISPGYIRQRFALLQGLADNSWGTGEFDPFVDMPPAVQYWDFATLWANHFFGSARPELCTTLLKALRLSPKDAIRDTRLAKKLVTLLASAPSFHTQSILPSATSMRESS